MRRGASRLAALVLLVPAFAGAAGPLTRVTLTEGGTERRIAAAALSEGEEMVLTWTNSLFGLRVTEVFTARAGRLVLTEVSFADPAGGEPPRVRPEDVDDLYHTGGPFRAEGLSRPVSRVVFRVGQIGDPVIRLGGTRVRLLDAVGFGGAVRLEAGPVPGETEEGGVGPEAPAAPSPPEP
ncbi:MAG: hypothetical protein ACE147_07080 [Candidatus Methylomirabilales bacterium]